MAFKILFGEKYNFVFLIMLFFISCNNKPDTTKFLGNWKSNSYDNFRCTITQSGDNFIIKYTSRPPIFISEDDLNADNSVPAFYTKSYDKLVIKSNKELDAVYDKNKNELVVEKWGSFRKE